MLSIDQISKEPDLSQKCIDIIKSTGLPTVLFGFGGSVFSIYDCLAESGLEIRHICDNDSNKHGITYRDATVIPFIQLKKIYDDCNIIINVRNRVFIEQILEQIKIDGQYKNVYVFELFYPFGSIVYKTIMKSFEKIKNLYDLLEDDLSRSVLLGKLNYIVTKDNRYIANISSPEEYFPQDIFVLSKDDVFLDIGAFHGEDTLRLVNLIGGLKHAYCFEPDPSNYEILKESVKAYPFIESYNYAVWDKNTPLTFAAAGTMGSGINKNGKVHVKGVALDSFFSSARVTFIKMDVEGAETNALKGAERIITEQNPKLAICIYHKVNDHWEIPLLIKSINPNYRIFMRHHNQNGIETVCYATL